MLILLMFSISFASSVNYLIPSYYGSREQDFVIKSSILEGNISSFYFQPRVTLQNETYYVGDNHAIYKIDGGNTYFRQDSRILVGGNPSIAGYRDGNTFNALFGNIKSVIYFQKNETLAQMDIQKKVIIVTSSSCDNLTMSDYTGCEDNKDNSTTIDPKLIREIYPDVVVESIDYQQYIYIVDSSNHCIRQIDLKKQIVSTIAGICQSSGFKDGVLGVSQFNNPDQMGIDVLGNLFIYDLGNRFMRKIDPKGVVTTLINGACREDKRFEAQLLQNLSVRRVICLKNWIKTSGEPSGHLVTESYNICTEHYLDCGK